MLSTKPPQGWRLSFAAFCLPAVMLLGLYAWLGIAPFGDKSLLTLDLRQQYVTFYAWLKDALAQGTGLTYSLYKGVGGETVGILAYYLFSPLNVFFLVFDKAHLPEAVLVITLVKVGLSGLTMSVLLRRRPGATFAPCLGLSCAYALSAYSLFFQSNLMWLDGVYLLPLLALGLERLFAQGRPGLYMAALVVAIVSCYYVGFMLCLFSVLYALYLLIARQPARPLRKMGLFALSSALGAGMTAALLLPTLASLSGGKAVFSPEVLTLAPNFGLMDFFAQLVGGNVVYEDLINGLPNIACGLVTLLLGLTGLLSRDMPMRERLGLMGLMLILGLSMGLSGINLLWHGLNAPVWFPYRYSFAFVFVAILAAQQGWAQLSRGKARLALPLAAALCGVLLVCAAQWIFRPMGWGGIAPYGGVLVLGSGLSWLLSKGRRAGAGLLLALMAVDLLLGGYYTLRVIRYEPRQSYAQALDRIQGLQAVAEAREGSNFYRMEGFDSYTPNDGMLGGYRSLTHFSSSEKTTIRQFMRLMGVADTGFSVRYTEGSSMAMDAFLGVKYLYSPQMRPNVAHYQPVALVGEDTLYQNPYALPLAFGVTQAMAGLTYDTRDLVDWQNRLWAAALGDAGAPIYLSQGPIDLTTAYADIAQQGDYTAYTGNQAGEKATLHYRWTVTQAGPQYAYFLAPFDQTHEVELLVDGTPLGSYFHWTGYGIISLGDRQAGEEITLTMRAYDQLICVTSAHVFALNLPRFEAAISALKAQALNISYLGNTRIEGSITMPQDKDLLLLTAPYAPGWRAWVDGEEALVQPAAHALMAIAVPPGDHAIVLRYTPPGLVAGWGIALSAGLLSIVLILLTRKKVF